jgi:hypothetical protein
VNQVTLNGSGSTDPEQSALTYLWQRIPGGPDAEVIIASPNTVSTTVSNLLQGTYYFRLTVTDAGGAENHEDVAVTVNGSTTSCRSMSFDGIDDWVNIPDMTFAGDFTFETWVKLNEQGTAHSVIVGQEGWGQQINFFANKFTFYNPGGDVLTSTETNIPGRWTHYVLRRLSGTLTLYIDGVKKNSVVWTGAFIPKAIGRGDMFFKGQLDEMRFWDFAREEADITANYDKAIAASPQLVAYYRFNEVDAQQEVSDASGNNHGSLGINDEDVVGDASRSTDVPPVTNDCQPLTETRRGADLIESQANIGLKIFPNPVVSRTNIKVQVSHSDLYSIMVYDVQGRIHYSRKAFIKKETGDSFIVDFTGNSGFYIIQVKGGNTTKTEKIFKAK